MREIILDTETTGFDPLTGDRLVEIGCIELFNRVKTGEIFQRYINPEREVPEAAFKIHGLSTTFLREKPLFAEVVEDFITFIGDAPLIIHNAEFDMKFVNFELERIGRTPLPMERAIDTVRIARQKFPGATASLDALCRRFNIDNSSRTLHGALLDADLLAEVYLELTGGRQTGLVLEGLTRQVPGPGAIVPGASREATLDFSNSAMAEQLPAAGRPVRPARPHAPDPEEEAAHQAFIAKLKGALWLQ